MSEMIGARYDKDKREVQVVIDARIAVPVLEIDGGDVRYEIAAWVAKVVLGRLMAELPGRAIEEAEDVIDAFRHSLMSDLSLAAEMGRLAAELRGARGDVGRIERSLRSATSETESRCAVKGEG